MLNNIISIKRVSISSLLIFVLFNDAYATELTYKITPITLQNSGFFIASGINNSGVISGYSGGQTIRWQNGVAELLPVLSPPGFWSVAHAAINDLGQIAGSSVYTDGNQHTVVWNGSNLVDLGTAGGAFSRGFSINSLGQVAGSAIYPSNDILSQQQAVVWKDGKAVLLGHGVDGYSSIAYGINDSGVAAGYECYRIVVPYNCTATVWKGTDTYTLQGLGGTYSEGDAINNDGRIVGSAALPADTAIHAVVWDGARVTDLGTLGGDYSYARAINSKGNIVGASTGLGNSSPYHATLWVDNRIIDLNSMLDASAVAEGWVLASAVGINDKGDIIGMGYKNGESYSYLLSAVPEPNVISMLLVGLLCFALFCKTKLRIWL